MKTLSSLLSLLLFPVLALGAPPAPQPAPAPPAATEESAKPSFPAPSPALVRRAAALFDQLRQTISAQDHARIVREIADLGPPAIPIFVAELERHSKITWPVMIYALGATGDPRTIPILEQQLRHQKGRTYLDVLYALSLAGEPTALVRAMRSTHADTAFERNMTAIDFIAGAMGPPAVDVLLREIPRRSEKARHAALRALGTICDDRAVDFLLEWSRRKEAGDRRFALIALARIGDPRAIDRFIEGLGDSDPGVVEAAAEGLGYLRADRAAEGLARLLTDSAPAGVRLKAIWSLGLIGGETAEKPLIDYWPRASASERPLLVRAFGRLSTPAATPLLSDVALGEGLLSIDAAKSLARIPGRKSTDALLSCCSRAKSLDAGLEAGRALARRKDPRAIPCIVSRLREEIEVRHRIGPVVEQTLAVLARTAPLSAADTLDTLADSVAAPALAHRLRATAHGIRLVNETEPEIEPWLALLQDGTPEEIELAVERLGDLGDPRAIEPLRRLFGRYEASPELIPEALDRIDSERATPFLISLITDDLYRVPFLTPARNAAARALVRTPHAEHVSRALETAYREEGGEFFVPLLALARAGGKDMIPRLLQLKTLLLRSRSSRQVLRHERVNWAIRMLRTGREIPLEEVKDVD
ncbi:MAG: HEAT repeat domain-containing protein [Acidobacteriota bacterium]|nr:HEAT repeat domain-containing protein [Acidobacteriota bacterium]